MVIRYLDESGSIDTPSPKSKVNYVDDVARGNENIVEPQQGVGDRIRGDLADLGGSLSSPGKFSGYLADKGLLRSPQELGADALGSIMGASPELAQATQESVAANPIVQAIPTAIEIQQRSEGVRASATFGVDDAVKALMDAQTTINLFSEQGRQENVDRFKGIAENTKEGIVGGITGTEKRQFGEELKKRGVSSRISPWMGLGMEIMSDPLTYMFGGGIKAAEKAQAERLVKETDRIIPDNMVASSMEFLTKPNKNATDYVQQIKQVKDKLLELNELRETLPKDIVKEKSSKLLQELSDLRIDMVNSEAVDFTNNTIKRTPRFFSLITSFLEGRGKYGAAIARQLERADKTLNMYRAKWIARFDAEGNLDKVFKSMQPEERMNFVASLEGFEKPQTKLVQHAFDIADLNRREIAKGAVSRGVVVREISKDGKTITTHPFISRPNHFPHQVMSPRKSLVNPEGLKEALEYSVRTGKFKDIDEATSVFEAYSDAVRHHVAPSTNTAEELASMSIQATEKNKNFFEWIVKTGQADDISHAVKKFNVQMNKLSTPTNQSLELQRTLDIPFYDVDPTRVFTRYYSGAAKKFGEIEHFGPDEEILNSLLSSANKDLMERGIEDGAKDIAVMKDMINLVTGARKPADIGVGGFSRIARNLEAASSLTFAFVMNATQLMNTASVVGFKNTINAFVDAMTAGGKEYAFKSGAVFNEFTQAMYGINSDSISGKLARAVMENLTPFQAIERNNRVVTAIGAKNFVDELVGRLIAGKGKTYGAVDAAEQLRKMDIRPEKVLAKNGVDLEDYLKASQNVSTRTQFRARVQDAPEWASSDWGRVVFQFKNFISQQWKFMRNEIVREAKNGNFAPMARYAAIAPVMGMTAREVKGVSKSTAKAIASNFNPLSGMISPDAVNNLAKITSENKLNTDTDIQNLASAVADVGAFGMMFDIFRNIQYKGTGWLAGLSPALSDLEDIGKAVYDAGVPLVKNFAGEEDAKLINLKPLVRKLLPKMPVLSFARTNVSDAMLSDEQKRSRATRYFKEALSNNLPQDRIDGLKQGLADKFDLSYRQIRKSEKSAKKSIKTAKKKFRKESRENEQNPLGYFGF